MEKRSKEQSEKHGTVRSETDRRHDVGNLTFARLGGHTALEIRKLELELELEGSSFINHSCEWELIFRSLRPSIAPNSS